MGGRSDWDRDTIRPITRQCTTKKDFQTCYYKVKKLHNVASTKLYLCLGQLCFFQCKLLIAHKADRSFINLPKCARDASKHLSGRDCCQEAFGKKCERFSVTNFNTLCCCCFRSLFSTNLAAASTTPVEEPWSGEDGSWRLLTVWTGESWINRRIAAEPKTNRGMDEVAGGVLWWSWTFT